MCLEIINICNLQYGLNALQVDIITTLDNDLKREVTFILLLCCHIP